MDKKETIKYLTDLMATVQMAYFKGRLGVRNGDNTGGDGAVCGELWVHESPCVSSAAISIDLYDFGGDGLPVCDGLEPCTITCDDGSAMTGVVFCMCYNPDDELTPLVFEFEGADDGTPDMDVAPEQMPEPALKNVTAWLEGVLQPCLRKKHL